MCKFDLDYTKMHAPKIVCEAKELNMKNILMRVAAICGALLSAAAICEDAVPLPEGVKAVWDMEKAYRETTPTRERICINGLWRW